MLILSFEIMLCFPVGPFLSPFPFFVLVGILNPFAKLLRVIFFPLLAS